MSIITDPLHPRSTIVELSLSTTSARTACNTNPTHAGQAA